MIDLPFNGRQLYFNHATSLIGIGILWGLAIWCMADPEGSRAELTRVTRWRMAYTEYLVLLLVLHWCSSCLRVLHLMDVLPLWSHQTWTSWSSGSQPEFSDGTYFGMLFAAGGKKRLK